MINQILADPTLVTVAVNAALDVVWLLLPSDVLDALAWV